MDLNETYDFLRQPREKEGVIRRKEMQRDELRACPLPKAVRYDTDRVQSSPKDTMADVIARVDELDREIEQLKQEKARLLMEISDAIEQLDSDREKLALTAFYIKGLSMSEVADTAHYTVRRGYQIRKQGVEHLTEVLQHD